MCVCFTCVVGLCVCVLRVCVWVYVCHHSSHVTHSLTKASHLAHNLCRPKSAATLLIEDEQLPGRCMFLWVWVYVCLCVCMGVCCVLCVFMWHVYVWVFLGLCVCMCLCRSLYVCVCVLYDTVVDTVSKWVWRLYIQVVTCVHYACVHCHYVYMHHHGMHVPSLLCCRWWAPQKGEVLVGGPKSSSAGWRKHSTRAPPLKRGVSSPWTPSTHLQVSAHHCHCTLVPPLPLYPSTITAIVP